MERDGLLQLGAQVIYRAAGRMDETEVVYGRDKRTPASAVFFYLPVCHRNERDQLKLVKSVFKLQFPPVCDTERIPSVLFMGVSHFLNFNMPGRRRPKSDVRS